MLRWALAFLLATLLTTPLNAAPKLSALIIGNSGYPGNGYLPNPKNDSDLISRTLKAIGYETMVVNDGRLSDIHRSLATFAQVARSSDVAIIFFSGHGVGAKGTNWLIPVDAKLGREDDLPFQAVDIDIVMRATEGAKLRIVVFDACRNNRLPRTWGVSSRSPGGGLLPVEADDVLILYSAAPGQTASDGEGKNSPFTEALARRITEKNLPIQFLGGTVRDDVLRATKGEQRPFVSASITGRPLYLNGVVSNATIASAPQSLSITSAQACLPGGPEQFPIRRATTKPAPTDNSQSYYLATDWVALSRQVERLGSTLTGQITVCQERIGISQVFLVEGVYAAYARKGREPAPAKSATIYIAHRVGTEEVWSAYGEPISIAATSPHGRFRADVVLPSSFDLDGDVLAARICVGTSERCELTPNFLRPTSAVLRR